MNKKILILILASTIITDAGARRPLASGDIAGRKLLVTGLGWIGHVGLGTGDDIGWPTQTIIEALNEKSVIQFNSFTNFTSRSEYWGSRWGLGDYGSGTRAALVEAYHQSWWCPTYTHSTAYVIGQGDSRTQRPTKCAMWRCDTFVAWDFYSAGYPQIMNNRIMLPLNVFYTFPYANEDTFSSRQALEEKPPFLNKTDEDFSKISAEQLNDLDYNEFARIADIPLEEETPIHIQKEWELAAEENLNTTKRGIFLDRLAIIQSRQGGESFIKIYKKSKNNEVKAKVLQAIMIYYQNHWDQIENSSEKELLKKFYSDLLNKKLERNDADKVIRGYVDLFPPEEIIKNVKQIDKQMLDIEPTLELGLRQELSYKSSELEEIYLPSIIEILKKHNRSDLDAIFFGVTNLWYQNLKNKNSISQIVSYIKFKEKRYSLMNSNKKDLYLNVAKDSLRDLKNSLSMRD